MAKTRVDLLLVEQKLAESRSQAQRLVMAGQVRANGELVHKPADKFPSDVFLEVEKAPPYISRGGEKLAAVVGLLVGELGEEVFLDAAEDIAGDFFQFIRVERAQQLAEYGVVQFLVFALGQHTA